jgi:hydrogenase assembly chaperone HypC/HupF
MCFAVPGLITKVSGDEAIVCYKDIEKKCKLLVDAKEGDYVIAQSGYAISKVEKNEALRIFEAVK